MTDKRFTEIISTQKVIDSKTGKEYDCLIDDDLLKLLNDLHEENRALKCILAVDSVDYITVNDKKIDIPPYYEFEERINCKKHRREEYDEW